MARLSRIGFLAVAVVFHVVYIYSIFDIYFISPIVTGMRAHSVPYTDKAPAKRLVLFVGDGLRADKALQWFPDPSPNAGNSSAAQELRPMAPFIRSRILEHGTFGVSHTRVPTESRPGHVALIAGLYEDVAAVTTGWKLNPVNFDSVFNRSRHTWSWGSPDILPMFSTGAVPGRVEDATYGAEFEDYSKDAKELDYWVFDRVKKLFKDAEHDDGLDRRLRQDKNIFFLHLLGLDTTGHSYRPYSREYLHNIQVVDQGVKEITELVEEFFGDDETAFVFTADHGMSDWGSHGDGHPDNTRTPLVAWGAGVAKPLTVSKGFAPGHEDGFSHDWRLDHIHRHDVAQADVATLMAYLTGLEFPVNSVGELPLPFLDATPELKAKALLTNAKEILEMYHVKEAQKQETVLRYRPHQAFAEDQNSVESRVKDIERLIAAGEHEEAIARSDELIQLGLKGLRYLQTYSWLFLRTLVIAGYLGWIAFATTTAVDVYVLDSKIEASRPASSIIFFSSVLVGLYSVLFVQSSPLTYYAYAFFPAVFWEEVYARREALYKGAKKIGVSLSTGEVTKLTLNVGLYIATLEIMVQSYYHREIYTACYLLFAMWPLVYGWDFCSRNKALCVTWTLGCASMSVFTLLPANKVEDLNLIMLGGGLIAAIGALYIALEKSLHSPAPAKVDHVSRLILGVQTGLVVLAMVVTHSSASSLQAKQGLPLGAQVVSWATLVASLAIPFLYAFRPRSSYLQRLMVIFLAFGPLFVILTISYEGLFYVAISTTLISWVRLEYAIQSHFSPSSPATSAEKQGIPDALGPALSAAQQRDKALETGNFRALTLSDARICLFFLYLLQSSFFSTGNIASISSFSLDAVYRLLPIFDPFSQGALLLLKLLAPFALVSGNLGILTQRLRLREGALFVGVMAIGDYLTMRMFFQVRDEGSWLEIGESISHFIVVSVLGVFVAGLEALSGALVRGVEFEIEDDLGLAQQIKDAGTSVQKASEEMVNGGKKLASNGRSGKAKKAS